MSSARNSIVAAIQRYGSDVTLQYKPAANPAVGGDWPNPDAPALAPPDPKVVKAIVAPQQDVENQTGTSESGELPTESVQAVFTPDEDLNGVHRVVWQGNEYKIQYGDTYELANEKLAQVVILLRTAAQVRQPHG